MEITQRETSFFTGLGTLVVVVAILFFGVTMAAQQVGQRRARWQALQRQVTQAQAQATQRAELPARQALEAEAQTAAQWFVTPETVSAVQTWLEAQAVAQGVTITFMPTISPDQPAHLLPGFEGCYQVIPLVATIEARYRALGEYLTRVSTPGGPAAVSVRGATVTPLSSPDGPPKLKALVVFETFVWTPGAMPKEAPQSRDDRDGSERLAEPSLKEPPLPAYGRDPFDARWLGPSSAEGLTLSGIVWDARRPTCVVNGTVLSQGETIEGYTVVLITPTAVFLRLPAGQAGGDRELVLAAS